MMIKTATALASFFLLLSVGLSQEKRSWEAHVLSPQERVKVGLQQREGETATTVIGHPNGNMFFIELDCQCSQQALIQALRIALEATPDDMAFLSSSLIDLADNPSPSVRKRREAARLIAEAERDEARAKRRAWAYCVLSTCDKEKTK